jgi:cell division protein FtsN
MARAPQATRRRSAANKAVPTGLWVMVGGVIVLFIGLLIWLGTRPAQPPAAIHTLPLQAPAKSAAVSPKDAATQKDVREVRPEVAAKPLVPPPPRYDFYDMLPKQNVGETSVPPPTESIAAKPVPAPVPLAQTDVPPMKEVTAPEPAKTVASLPPALDKSKSAPANTGQVLVQVGAFRRYEEADRRKAELALLGYNASIQAANVNGETWHRVKIGPLSDADARKLRDRLKAVGMNPMLVKQGG